MSELYKGRLLVSCRKAVSASFSGGLKETKEMLNLCGEHDVVSTIEMSDINVAFERMKDNDVCHCL